MKRILLTLMVAGGLALMAAPKANATSVVPATPASWNNSVLCGNSYAMLITGGQDSSTQNYPVTGVVGVGVIKFGGTATGGSPVVPGVCDGTATGELILNNGDLQNTGVAPYYAPTGEMFGPAACYPALGIAEGGIACFDGTNHYTSAALTMPGPNGNGSADLTITASGLKWNDYSISATPPGLGPTAGSISLEFTLQIGSTSNNVTVGVSAPGTTSDFGAPLVMTLQKIGLAATNVATVFGAAPYNGTAMLMCSGYGANQTDPVAGAQNPPTIAGSFGGNVGSLSIFANGFAWGSLSFNDNDNIVASGPTPNNTDCAFEDFPGKAFTSACVGGYAAGSPCVSAALDAQCVTYGGTCSAPVTEAFADGTSNQASVITSLSTDPTCTDALTAGAGYTTSNVVWGSGDKNEYVAVTGLISTATGATPPGQMATCTVYNQGAASGTLTASNAPGTVTDVCSGGTCTPGSSVFSSTNTISAFENLPYCAVNIAINGGLTTSVTSAVATKVVTGVHGYTTTAQCTMTLPSTLYAPIYTPQSLTPMGFGLGCTCTEATISTGTPPYTLTYPVAAATSTLTISSPDCPMTPYVQAVKCQN